PSRQGEADSAAFLRYESVSSERAWARTLSRMLRSTARHAHSARVARALPTLDSNVVCQYQRRATLFAVCLGRTMTMTSVGKLTTRLGIARRGTALSGAVGLCLLSAVAAAQT